MNSQKAKHRFSPTRKEPLALFSILARMGIKELDISSNKIKVPFADHINEIEIKGCMQSVTSLNLSDNPIQSMAQTVRQLALAMPNLQDLQISLFKEEDVEYVINHMPSLQYLNNLPVERPKKWDQEGSQSTVRVQTS
jgi:Leucine-rich repeat (LRR) protein